MSSCNCTENKPRITTRRHIFVISCRHCGEVAIGLTMKQATEAWNKIQHEKNEAC